MLFKASKIKSLMKEAWKSTGLVVGSIDNENGINEVYIGGIGWMISIDYLSMSKELKGAIVELVGDIPLAGKEIISYKGYNQDQFGFYQTHNIREILKKELAGYASVAADTNLIISDPAGALRVYAYDNKIMTVLEKLNSAIDYGMIDSENDGESLLAERIYVRDAEMDYLIWATESCYVAGFNIDPDEDNQALLYLRSIER